MATEDEITAALDRMQASQRPTRVEDIAVELGIEDIDYLCGELERMGRLGQVWEVTTWWGDDFDTARKFDYFTRRSDVDSDIIGLTLPEVGGATSLGVEPDGLL